MTVEDVELHTTLTTCDQMRAEVRYVEARTPPKQESTPAVDGLDAIKGTGRPSSKKEHLSTRRLDR